MFVMDLMENVALALGIIIMMIMCKQPAIDFMPYIIFALILIPMFLAHLEEAKDEKRIFHLVNAMDETIKNVFVPKAFVFVNTIIDRDVKCFHSFILNGST